MPALAAGDPSYLPELQAQARQQRLAQAPYWHKLLHYRSNHLLPGVTSIVDSALFYTAATGKTDPQAELDATLASFFSDTPRFEEPTQCRTKARYEWLRRQLNFDAVRLPPQRCEYFEKFSGSIKPDAITLVFAASDLNSPATMYGHTLLRIDAKGQNPDEQLLAHSVNYAAAVTAGDPFLYAIQGAMGGFVGEFSIYRYYERVRQYVRINNRDLWEYPVRLESAQLERVIWHLWEMRGIGSDYFFFSENCSYMLLTLLETADENLSFSASFDQPLAYVIPVDTIRVLRDAGMLGEPVLRPSMARGMAHRYAQLTTEQQDWVLAYARNAATLDDSRLTQSTAREQARMLETANDYLSYRFEAGSTPRDYALPASRAALVARSRITEKSAFEPLVAQLTPPDQGHGSSRVDLGLRADELGSAATLGFRPAYHDRLDPPAGFLPGGEIEFFDLALQVGEAGAQVTQLNLVNVQSLTPWDRMFRPWLWQAAGGLRRYGSDALATRHDNALGGFVEGGLGYALGSAERWLTYGFAFTSFDINRDVENGYAIGAGLRTGLALTWSNRLTQELQADWLADAGGGAQRQLKVSLGTQWQLAPAHGLRLLFNRLEADSNETQSAELRWQYYFCRC